MYIIKTIINASKLSLRLRRVLMKNFIFISPHFPQSYWRFCLALKNNGFNVLGIGDAPYNELSDECKYALTEYYCCQDMENIENEKRAVEYFKNKYGPIDFLESNNEYWLEKDALLRTEFGIPNGPDSEFIKRYKFKSLQKEYYKKAGLKTARFEMISDPEAAKKFIELVGYPVFIKPDNGVGAQDTYKISNEADLAEFFAKKDAKKAYIMEEYIDGTIVSFDGVTNSKSEPLFYTSNVFMNDNSQIVHESLDDMYYCIPQKLVPEDLVDAGKRTLLAFNTKNRFFHLEFFRLNKDHPYLGKAGTIVPLEVNMRPGGGYTPDLINFANSINCYNVYAYSIAYDENREPSDYETYYACACSRRDIFKYVHTLNEILEKYRNSVCFYGTYPLAIRDDMGDSFVFAKFKTLDELFEFDNFVREKAE